MSESALLVICVGGVVTWNFLENLCGGDHGKLLLGFMALAAAAFALGGAIFNYLRDRIVDKWGREIKIKKRELAGLEEVLKKKEKGLSVREDSINILRKAMLGSDDELWRLHDVKPPSKYRDLIGLKEPPVIFVCNEKGGVAKSTTTINLAAHFAVKQRKRVLVIDLDHQGSTSNTFLASVGITTVPSNLNSLLAKGSTSDDFQNALINMGPRLPGIDLIPSLIS